VVLLDLGRQAGFGLREEVPAVVGVQVPDVDAVIDPASGSLLATEEIAPIPRSVQCWIQPNVVGQTRCIGDSYLGRSYKGQVGEFVALVSAAWTDASPSLPSATREDPTGFPGLPPAGP
jgi:hypothetical protein